jgi:hypothetical protein
MSEKLVRANSSLLVLLVEGEGFKELEAGRSTRPGARKNTQRASSIWRFCSNLPVNSGGHMETPGLKIFGSKGRLGFGEL